MAHKPNLLCLMMAFALAACLCGCQAPSGDGAMGKKAVPLTEPETLAPAGDVAPASQPAAETPDEADAQPSGDASIHLEPIPAKTRSRPESWTPSPSAGRQMSVGGREVVSSSVIQVNSQFITVDDIVRSANVKLGAIPKDASAAVFRTRATQILTDEIYRQMSEYMVMAEANSRFTDEQKKLLEKEVDQALRVLTSDLGGGSKKKLEEVLVQQGTSLEAVLGDHRRRVTVRAFLHEKIVPQIKINRQMLWDYYQQHLGEFTQPAQVAMQTISLPVASFLPAGGVVSEAERQAARLAAREEIAKAQAELQAGKNFAEVATAYSKDSKAGAGGLWPAMPSGSFRESKVEAAAFAMKQGQVSDIIETDSGYYIVRTAAIQPGKTTSFEEAQDKIDDTLRKNQERELTDEYFKKLQEGMSVVPYSNFLELAVEKAAEKHFKK